MTENKSIAEVVIELDKSEVAEWEGYMFASDSTSACIRDYCIANSVPEQDMWKLIAMGLFKKQLEKTLNEWKLVEVGR